MKRVREKRRYGESEREKKIMERGRERRRNGESEREKKKWRE